MTRTFLTMTTAFLLLAACAAPPGGMGSLALTDEPLHGKFIWSDLLTDDPEAAKAFYGGLFGWTFERESRRGDGAYWLAVSRDGQYVGGVLELDDPEGGEDYSRWLPYLAVPDADGAAEEVDAAGGEVVVAPRDLEAAARVAAVTDPQGAVLGLIESRVGYPDDENPGGEGIIRWHELLAADDREAATFYSGLVGFEVVEQPRDGGVYFVLSASGRDRAGIMQRPNEQVTPLWLTHFEVADPVAAAERAANLGGKIILAPSAEVRDGRLALVEDPTGAVLALSRPPR